MYKTPPLQKTLGVSPPGFLQNRSMYRWNLKNQGIMSTSMFATLAHKVGQWQVVEEERITKELAANLHHVEVMDSDFSESNYAKMIWMDNSWSTVTLDRQCSFVQGTMLIPESLIMRRLRNTETGEEILRLWGESL